MYLCIVSCRRKKPLDFVYLLNASLKYFVGTFRQLLSCLCWLQLERPFLYFLDRLVSLAGQRRMKIQEVQLA